MADAFRLSIAVLAAGRSTRFGEADKLATVIGKSMLGLYAINQLAQVDAAQKYVIAASDRHQCAKGWCDAGFEIVVNPDAVLGMGTSVAVAATLARTDASDALLVCLADMPLVPLSHYEEVISEARLLDEDGIVASGNGTGEMPPACFRSGRFKQLASLRGDIGARRLLTNARIVQCAPQLLLDVDDPGDMSKLAALLDMQRH